jgi:hypothetical protein
MACGCGNRRAHSEHFNKNTELLQARVLAGAAWKNFDRGDAVEEQRKNLLEIVSLREVFYSFARMI